jgi:mRNA-degrading endonuclease toxin of MazEF toxin-antitoxin module
VVSENLLNKHGFVWVLPITNTLHGPGRFILPEGEPVQGAVLFTQLRSLDLEARSFVLKGVASDDVLDEALGKIAAVLGIG